MNRKSLAPVPIKCDRCGQSLVCLFTYEDPHEDYLPMIFCSLDCLTHYVRQSPPSSGLIHPSGLLVKAN